MHTKMDALDELPCILQFLTKIVIIFDAHIPIFTFFYSPKLVKIRKSCRTWTWKIYVSFGPFTKNREQLGTGVREKKFYRFK